MSTLEFLNLDKCDVNQKHPVWKDLNSPLDIRKATIKALLLVKRYPLTTSRVMGTKMTENCPLCQKEPETTVHFLLHCTSLQSERNIYLPRVLDTARYNGISVDTQQICMLILDSNNIEEQQRAQHEKLTRNFVFKLHSRRSLLLGGDSAYRNIT
jgi:hypothetical protein